MSLRTVGGAQKELRRVNSHFSKALPDDLLIGTEGLPGTERGLRTVQCHAEAITMPEFLSLYCLASIMCELLIGFCIMTIALALIGQRRGKTTL